MQDLQHNWLLESDAPLPSPSASSQRSEIFDAVIGPASYVTGVVHLEGLSRIDGRVEGELTANGELIIGEKGIVRANIAATRVRVLGTVIGDIECEEHLELGCGARVQGDIKAPSLVIEDGVVFEGFCSMTGREEGEGEVLELSSTVEKDEEERS